MQFTPLPELSAADRAIYESLPIQKFSYDDGYYAKKFFSTFVPKGGSLRSLVGSTTQRMSTSSVFLNAQTIEGVEIKDGPIRYLFGLHADQQLSSENLSTKSSDNVTAGNLNLQQFFAASMRLAFPTPGRYHLRGAVMMPVNAFKVDALFKEHVKDALIGLHSIESLVRFDDTGAPVYETFEFYVDRILVLEQPLGSLFKVAFNPPEGVQINFDELTSLRNTFLDWGMGTLDVFTVDNMKKRIDSMCGSANAGIRVLFDSIRSSVLEPAGMNPTPMMLERAVMAGRFKDRRHKRFWSAETIANNGYIDLRPYIQEGLDAMWQASMRLFDATIGTTAESVDNIFITGGASGWTQPFVLDQFGEHRVFKVMNTTPTINPKLPYEHLMLSEDLHLRNAHGGYLYILSLP